MVLVALNVCKYMKLGKSQLLSFDFNIIISFKLQDKCVSWICIKLATFFVFKLLLRSYDRCVWMCSPFCPWSIVDWNISLPKSMEALKITNKIKFNYSHFTRTILYYYLKKKQAFASVRIISVQAHKREREGERYQCKNTSSYTSSTWSYNWAVQWDTWNDGM